MYYTLYRITNLIDSKIYIGVHKTNDLNDGYMGSGVYINRDINKHGVENFIKEIIHISPSQEQIFEMEGLTVNQTFVVRKDTYNLKVDGFGGWDYINNANLNLEGFKFINNNHLNNSVGQCFITGKKLQNDTLFKQYFSKCVSDGIKENKRKNDHFKDKTHTNKTKKIMSLSHQGKHDGEKNSQYGTCWVYNLDLKENKSIPKDDLDLWIEKGYLKGRKMKF